MDSIASEGQERDYERSIKERLKEIEDLLRLKKYGIDVGAGEVAGFRHP
jgi:hypothetical protein